MVQGDITGTKNNFQMDRQPNYSGNYSRIVKAGFEHKDGELFIHADIYIDAEMISKDEHLEVTPVLYCGQQRLELPQVLVNGRHRHRAYKQMCRMLGQRSLEKAYHIYRELCAGKDLHCPYLLRLPYQGWMDTAGLELQEW